MRYFVVFFLVGIGWGNRIGFCLEVMDFGIYVLLNIRIIFRVDSYKLLNFCLVYVVYLYLEVMNINIELLFFL